MLNAKITTASDRRRPFSDSSRVRDCTHTYEQPPRILFDGLWASSLIRSTNARWKQWGTKRYFPRHSSCYIGARCSPGCYKTEERKWKRGRRRRRGSWDRATSGAPSRLLNAAHRLRADRSILGKRIALFRRKTKHYSSDYIFFLYSYFHRSDIRCTFAIRIYIVYTIYTV